MFEIPRNSRVVQNIISLSKESFFHPFRIEFTVMYQYEKEVHYIRDDRNNYREYIEPGEILSTLLDIIVEEKITEYPFEITDFNEGTPIDEIDFFTDSNASMIETTPFFMRFLRDKGYIEEQVVYDEDPVDVWVQGPHLTKFQLTFEKASELSTLSFQLFSRYPVDLLSLVSERDLMSSSAPDVINLNNISMSTDNDTVTLMFAEPIFTKRITFVLGQHNADENTYLTFSENY